jgi:hypothetical protein
MSHHSKGKHVLQLTLSELDCIYTAIEYSMKQWDFVDDLTPEQDEQLEEIETLHDRLLKKLLIARRAT